MQVVGRKCEECEERIASADGAVGCVHCELSWHLACLPDADGEPVCPRCHVAFSKSQAIEEEEEARALERYVARGRRFFFVGATMVLLVGVVSALLRGSVDGSPIGFVRLAISAALLWAVWRGHGWARTVAVVLYALGAAVAVVVASGTDLILLRATLIAVGFIYGVFAGALIVSDALRTYLERNARVHGLSTRDE